MGHTVTFVSMGGGQFYVNTSFHVSKAKPRTGLWPQQVCVSFHKNGSKLSHMLCHLYFTSMTCALQHQVFCSTNMGFICVSLKPWCYLYSVSQPHVTTATGPSPFLLVKPLLACCCTKSSLYVLDTSSCATGASQMFPHSLCLFFHLSYLS